MKMNDIWFVYMPMINWWLFVEHKVNGCHLFPAVVDDWREVNLFEISALDMFDQA